MIKLVGFKKVMIFGLGVTGSAVLRSAVETGGIDIYAWDDNVQILDKHKSMYGGDLIFIDPEMLDWRKIDVLILSPGVLLNYPKPHRVVELARRANCQITVDIELLWRAEHKNSKFIAITGSNGKSTTTKLIYDILNAAGFDIQVGGNMGVPVMTCDSGKAVYVLELSSFQLDLLLDAEFDHSVLLNITPDHLERYSSIDDYAASKLRIFKNSAAGNTCFIGVDSQLTRQIYERRSGSLVPFSSRSRLNTGVSCIDGEVCWNSEVTSNQIGFIIKKRNNLLGRHNEENIGAAVSVALSMGVDIDIIRDVILNFSPLPHRCQPVAQIANILFVNDSKATNADSMKCALESYVGHQVFLILGGREKELNSLRNTVDILRELPGIYLVGESMESFASAIGETGKIYRCGTLDAALHKAYRDARDINDQALVLLSPACASFDQWKNFEERGNAFIDLVRELTNKLSL